VRKKSWWASLFVLLVTIGFFVLMVNINNGNVQQQIGNMYRDGTPFLNPNEKKAIAHYRQAVDKGRRGLLYEIKTIYEKNPSAYNHDVALVELMAKDLPGSVVAQYRLGLMYENDLRLGRDMKKAVVWHKKSAEAGYFPAQYHLCQIYYTGSGALEKNYAESAKWCARIFVDKSTLPQPHEKLRAAEILNKIGVLYYQGIFIYKDYNEVFRLFFMAAVNGNRDGAYNVGLMYRYGKGVTQNRTRAISWFRNAANRGDKGAEQELRRLGVSR